MTSSEEVTKGKGGVVGGMSEADSRFPTRGHKGKGRGNERSGQ